MTTLHSHDTAMATESTEHHSLSMTACLAFVSGA